jgi:HAD superfamily hydrolase (TIGR01509 family)
MIRALLFDLDGLLTDTERLHMASYQECFGEFGVEISEKFYTEHWIRLGLGVDAFCALQQLPHEPAVMRSKKREIYHRLVREQAVLMPGARDVLERFTGRMKMALVTSSHHHSMAAVLSAVGVGHYFDVLITGDDVVQTKPDPAGFLLAADRLGVTAAECLVLEDAEKGILAADAAGMLSIAVPNSFTAHNDFGRATRVLSSLDEVTDELLAAMQAT